MTTTNTPTDLHRLEENNEPLRGFSLQSLLRQIADEHKSYTVQVESGSKQGILFMQNGILIDAEHEQLSGLEGAYRILSWDKPVLTLGKAQKRSQQIANLLSKNLLKATPAAEDTAPKKSPVPPPEPSPQAVKAWSQPQPDDVQEKQIDITLRETRLTYPMPEAEKEPLYQVPTTVLAKIDAVQTFFILSLNGKVAVHSALQADIGELIIYAIVTCSKLKKSVDTKALKRIQMQMEDETTLLILPLAGVIIGMILKPATSADGIVEQLQSTIL